MRLSIALLVLLVTACRRDAEPRAAATQGADDGSATPAAGCVLSKSSGATFESGTLSATLVVATSDVDQQAAELAGEIWSLATNCAPATRLHLVTQVSGTDKYGNPASREVDRSTFDALDEVRRYRTAAAYQAQPPMDHVLKQAVVLTHIGCALGTTTVGCQ